MTDRLVTTATEAYLEAFTGQPPKTPYRAAHPLAMRAAVGAVLAALREEVEALRREQPEWASYELVGVKRYNLAVDDMLALLAAPENDQPKCPECNGTGVREISSSGDSETGFEREWDACDCGRVPGVNTGATDRRPSAHVVNQGGTMTNMDALREYERRQGQMGTIAELLASEYGGDSADWEDIAYKILDRMAVVENDHEA